MFPLMRRQDGGVPSQKRQSMRSQQVATLTSRNGEEAGLGGVVDDVVVEILDEVSVAVRMQRLEIAHDVVEQTVTRKQFEIGRAHV